MPQFKDVNSIREELENREIMILSDIATKAKYSVGRKKPEEESIMSTPAVRQPAQRKKAMISTRRLNL